MNLASRLWLLIFCFALFSSAAAQGLQSYEAGIQPIKSRINTLDNLIAATNSRLTSPNISVEEKQLRLKCLEQYSAEKAQLEADLEAGRKLSELPGVMYFSNTDEHLCSAGLAL